MANVVWHNAANADYQAIHAWYLARSQKAADGFKAAAGAAAQFIEAMPLASPFVDKTHRRCGLHRYPHGLIYRVDGTDVIIIAVAHDRQSSGHWSGRS